jgi:hypothetical protein
MPDMIDLLGHAAEGMAVWRYLLSPSYRRRTHSRWRSQSRLETGLDNAAANKYDIFCVAVSKGETASDAPAKLIQNLNDATHKLVKSSDCNENEGNGVTERASGKPALMLNVGQVKWLTKDEVIVKGGYYEASLSSSGNTYQLKKISDVWRVMKDELNWIS